VSRALADLVGVGAGLCTMASFVPQIVKIVRERDAGGVSLRMYLVTVAGFSLWTGYGVLSGSWPVAASNLINLALAGIILALRAKFGDAPQGSRKTRQGLT
jgi:MtN3 and saliva related transmembrane protein